MGSGRVHGAARAAREPRFRRRERPALRTAGSSVGVPTAAWNLLRELFRKREEPYAGADLVLAKRLGGLLWLLTAAPLVALLPLYPPTERIGNAGWAVALAVIAGATIGARLVQRQRAGDHYELLLKSYTAVLAIAAIEWLAGGYDSPYWELFLLWALYTSAVHPPRPAAVFMVVLALAASAPLAYDGWDAHVAEETALHLVFWVALGVLAVSLIGTVRTQRLAAREREATAARLARVDPLTEVGNRRALHEALGAEVARARRSGEPLTLATVDLDDFKTINDRYGHVEGDRALKAVAVALGEAVRRPDYCFRWGGDEFALVLPNTDRTGAETACERIASILAELWVSPDGEALGVRWGIAQLTEKMGADDLLAAADSALVEAKATL